MNNFINKIRKEHFDEFVRPKTSRLFGKTLIANGYERVKTNCFNNKPLFYKKK